jgi:predicted dithiol-disulfide oxidoreductase (DUF899 family)
MNTPSIVSPQEWEAARQKLLVKERELTRRNHRPAPRLMTPMHTRDDTVEAWTVSAT